MIDEATFRMPNKGKRMTDRELVSADMYEMAVEEVTNLNESANVYYLYHASFHRFMKKKEVT